jgi:hypothetical protein
LRQGLRLCKRERLRAVRFGRLRDCAGEWLNERYSLCRIRLNDLPNGRNLRTSQRYPSL